MQTAVNLSWAKEIKGYHYGVCIQEGEFCLREVTEWDEVMAAYHLRHRVFSQELGWVAPSADSLETDAYDGHASFLGVFDAEERLVAFLRLVPAEEEMMMEREFPMLVGHRHEVRKERDTVEVSRLCVAPEARNCNIRGNFGLHSITMLLYKGVYHWCIMHDVRYLYLVVEEKIFRLLNARGFPCKLIGTPLTMPDGVVAVAGMIDWREFETTNAVKRPKFLEWFASNM